MPCDNSLLIFPKKHPPLPSPPPPSSSPKRKEMDPSSSFSSSSSSSSSSSNIYHPNANWLAFSLSVPAQHIPPYPPFHPTTDEEPPLGSVPKLAEFLGGPTLASHFPEESSMVVASSELNTISASFLRGFSDDQQLHRTLEKSGKKAVDTFGQRTSIYRGVTRHRWTGRYEAHLWDNSCRREGQSRKGRQVYLGGYDKEDKAARAYDLAALKYWGPTTTTNFPVCNYEREVEEMKQMTRQEFVASLRRKSSGFSRGASIYRGVTRHHQHGRWQARIGRVAGNKDLYLGTFSTQEEAAEAYDIAAIKFRGLNAVTNFDMSRYDVKSIMSSNLPIGGMSGKSRTWLDSPNSNNRSVDDCDGFSSASSLSFSTHHQRNQQPPHNSSPSSTLLSFAIPIKEDPVDCLPLPVYNHQNDCSSQFLHSSTLYENYHHQNYFDFQGGSVYVQPQQQCEVASLPYAPATLTDDSNGTSSGTWMMMGPPPPPTLHSFQTPIYGME